jgi:hypothetical protein
VRDPGDGEDIFDHIPRIGYTSSTFAIREADWWSGAGVDPRTPNEPEKAANIN